MTVCWVVLLGTRLRVPALLTCSFWPAAAKFFVPRPQQATTQLPAPYWLQKHTLNQLVGRSDMLLAKVKGTKTCSR